MGRKKGSLNKKNQPIQLDFEDNRNSFEEKTEVCMTLKDQDHEIDQVPALVDTTLSQGALDKENELEDLNRELDEVRIELEKARLDIEAKKRELAAIPKPVATSDVPAIAVQGLALNEKIASMKERDSVLVTGKFYNLRVKGQSVKLPYVKYGDEPVKWWPFSHGQVYTIPKGFADQINGGSESDPCYYMPTFIKNEGAIINLDEPGTGIHSVDTSDKKYSFVPLNFS